jgi:hypothetical protein
MRDGRRIAGRLAKILLDRNAKYAGSLGAGPDDRYN